MDEIWGPEEDELLVAFNDHREVDLDDPSGYDYYASVDSEF